MSLHPPPARAVGPADTATPRQFTFTDADFRRVCGLIHARAGIALGEHKREMVYSRLSRRLRARGLTSFDAYLAPLERDADAPEWEAFVNALTTNLTAFFREPHHFPLLAAHVAALARPVSVWCAAASTGEEPYSIAMTLAETLGHHAGASRVHATDIDTQVLARAQAGVYPAERVSALDATRLRRFFLRGRGPEDGRVRVRPELARMVTFDVLNLRDPHWRLPVPFDIVFCRNVMIYFDKSMQAQILQRLARCLVPGGLLFAGHSENFTQLTREFQLRGQTVYQRVAVS